MTSADEHQNRLDLARIEAIASLRDVDYRDTMPSTNDLALELAADPSLATPTLVLAGEQTAGRGRGANRWWSAPGALTFSLVVEPADVDLVPDHWPRLSLAVAVAACDALGHFAPSVAFGVRWPNDVMAHDRKLGGILIEAPHHGSSAARRLVVGVGLNVNNPWREAPAELRAVATSLSDTTGQSHNLTEVLLQLLAALGERLAQLSSGDSCLPAAWGELCVLRGHRIEVERGRRAIWGHCQGIAEDGALLIDTDGRTERLLSGVLCSVDNA